MADHKVEKAEAVLAKIWALGRTALATFRCKTEASESDSTPVPIRESRRNVRISGISPLTALSSAPDTSSHPGGAASHGRLGGHGSTGRVPSRALGGADGLRSRAPEKAKSYQLPQKAEYKTVMLGIYTLAGMITNWNFVMAGVVVVVLPMLALFFVFQGFFIRGFTVTGMKG